MNEVIEKRLAKCADDILKFDDELADAKDRLKQNPTNENASAVSIAREKLEGARNALAEAEAEKARAEAFIKSSEYKAESKRMNDIKAEADKLLSEVPAKVVALLEYIDGIDKLSHEYNKIATRHNGGSFSHAWEYARCWRLQAKLMQWHKDWKSAKVGNQPSKPAKRTDFQKAVDDMRYRDPEKPARTVRLNRDTSLPDDPDATSFKG